MRACPIVGQICADLGPDCSRFVKSTKFSGITEVIIVIWCHRKFYLLNWILE